MSLDQLENAITQLPPEELAAFRHWFAEFDSDAWDAQFAEDALTGRLDVLAEQALEAHRSGQSRPL